MDEQTYQKFREEVAIKSAKRLGAMVGRGWELSPFDQTHLKQIQAGSHDTLTVNSSAIYAEYVAKNTPVVDPEQVEKIKKGLSVDNEEGAIVKEMAKKMAQTNHLDPAEQSLLDYYQSRSLTSGTAAEKISIYNTVLLETSKNLPPQEQPVHLSAPSVTTPEPDMTGKPVEIQPEVHHSLTPSSEPIRENPVVEQNPVVAHVSGSEIPSVGQTVQEADSAQPQSQGPDWVIYVAPVTDEQPTPSPETSYAENLRFFEGIEASEYELLLPAEYEDIRAYLKNDSYLSNEEITVALYDASLTKDELAHKVDTIGDTKTDDQTKERITNYLWDIHQTVMDSPFKDLDPTASYQVTAIQQRTIKPEEDPALNQEAKSQKEPKNPQQNEDGILRTALKLKVFEGGMVANMLHNYKTMALLMEKILYRSEQDKLTQTPQNKIMETPVLAPRYTWDQVEKDIKPFGLTKESLQKSGNLDDFLNGRRTGVLSLNQTDAGGTVTPLSGKLYIAEVPNQGPRVFIQAQKEEIRLPNSYLGHTLTPEDKKTLLAGKEMGRAVELTDKLTNEKFMAYIGLDTQVNKLTVLRQERVKWPDVIKGVPITPQQKVDLMAGKAIRVNGMKDNETNQTYSADVRVSAVKRSLQFIKVPEQAQKQTVNQEGSAQSAKQKKQQGDKVTEKTQKQAKPETADPRAELKRKKTPDQKVGTQADSKKAVSVVEKNGQSRTSVSKTAGDTTLKTGSKEKTGQSQQEAIVNGVTKGNKVGKGPKVKAKSGMKI